jgi:hypothetical protein
MRDYLHRVVVAVDVIEISVAASLSLEKTECPMQHIEVAQSVSEYERVAIQAADGHAIEHVVCVPVVGHVGISIEREHHPLSPPHQIFISGYHNAEQQ